MYTLKVVVWAGCVLLSLSGEGRHPRKTTSICAFYRDNYLRLVQNIGRCSESYVCRKLPTNRTCDVLCIPKSQRCDGSPQCPLQDDEETCPNKCQPGSFLCPSGKCAPICDGQVQCDGPGDNNDDERNCSCPMKQLRCPNGQCAVRCDGIPECDMTLELAIDEQNCSCMAGQTRCQNGTCVTPCNETPECTNGDDESICTCPPGRFTCPDNSCAMQCDENPECADQSDEDRLLCFGDLCRLATNDAECTAYSDEVALCKGGQNGMCDPLTGLVRRSQGGVVFACLCVSADNDVGPDVCQRLGYSTGAQTDAGQLGEVCTVFHDCRGSALVADCSGTSGCLSPDFLAAVVCQP